MNLQQELQAALSTEYRVDREIGAGGMSRVFLARDEKLNRDIVVKVLPPELASSLSIDRFQREIRIAASLQHPHIVPVLMAGEIPSLGGGGAGLFMPFYAMPFVHGMSLREYLSRPERPAEPDALRILLDIARALGYAHRQGIIHRDVKPDNILLTDGVAVVTDFGIAKALSAARTGEAGRTPVGTTLTELGTSLGTPAYMAPEQAAGDPAIDHRADIYALGVVAYELFAGTPPFHGRPRHELLAAQISETPRPLKSVAPGVAPAVARLVMRCLEKSPAARPQTVDDVARALEAAAGASVGERRRVGRIAAAYVPAVAGFAALAWAATQLVGLPELPIDVNRIAVLPFRVTASDSSFNFLREGMAELLAGEFTGEGGPRAVDPGTALRAWDRVRGDRTHVDRATAIDVARGLGAGQLLDGAVVAAGRRITVTASIVGLTRTGERGAPVVVEGTVDSLAPIVANLVSRLLSRGTEVWHLSANAPGSTSPDAVRTFIEGRSALRRMGTGRAIPLFSRALDIDTTFVQSAYWLTMMAALEDGVNPTLRARASHFAWQYRARLGREQRELLEGVLGPDGPEAAFSRAMAHAALERLARSNNNLPEAWQLLGDSYLHYGALLGYDDWLPRAKSAFERVAAIDSAFGNFQHLTTIAYLERNDTEHARWLERLTRRLPNAPETRFERWVDAIIRGNTADIHDAREQFAQTGGIGGWPWVGGVPLPWPQIDSLVVRLDSLARTDAQRRQAKRLTKMVALNAGQPARAAAAARAFYGIDSLGRDLDALIWASDDDSAAAARVFKALGTRDTVPNAWLMYCEAMLARLRGGDTTGLGRTLTALRATAAQERGEPGQPRLLNATQAAHREARACASLISAIATSLSPGAGVSSLLVADSMMRFKPWHTPTGEMNPQWNYDLARAFARHQKWRLAAAAARRRLFGRGTRLAISLRDEGRWALLANDTAAALHAFERYLVLRPDPEPSVASEVAVVRRQVVVLRSAERTP